MKTKHYFLGKRFGKLLVTKEIPPINGDRRWECLCDCGNVTMIRTHAVLRKTSPQVSCGCVQAEVLRRNHERQKKPTGEAALNRLLLSYQSAAKNKSLPFTLSKEQFKEITSKHCSYCGLAPAQLVCGKNLNGNYLHNGIDRATPSLGYTLENSKPCCKACNIAKHTMTAGQFVNWISKVWNHVQTSPLAIFVADTSKK